MDSVLIRPVGSIWDSSREPANRLEKWRRLPIHTVGRNILPFWNTDSGRATAEHRSSRHAQCTPRQTTFAIPIRLHRSLNSTFARCQIFGGKQDVHLSQIFHTYLHLEIKDCWRKSQLHSSCFENTHSYEIHGNRLRNRIRNPEIHSSETQNTEINNPEDDLPILKPRKAKIPHTKTPKRPKHRKSHL